jgi:hypothetical protein
MKLVDKGSFHPRPGLEGLSEQLAHAVESWPEVHARTHWELGDERIVDGADFYVGDKELGHIHLYGEAHLALPRPLADAVIAAKLARPFRWSEAFVVIKIKTAADARNAEWLFALAYDRLRGEALPDLVTRIATRAA